MEAMNLTNHFLIATPSLADPNFQQTVTYICAHNTEGAMGIIINRPMSIDLGDVLLQMNLEPLSDEIRATTIYQGGPVQQDRGFIIYNPPSHWDSTINVSGQLGVATSRDILEAISRGQGPGHALVALGYAGWGSGQLEHEIADNAWLNCPADAHILFEVPCEQRWRAAVGLLGIDLEQLSPDIGHA